MKSKKLISVSISLILAVIIILTNYFLWIERVLDLSYINQHYGNLPVVRIKTENNAQITSKEDYVKSTVSIENNETAEFNFQNYSAGIRGRGNSTWDKAKKPYRIKFDVKTSVFGLPAATDWTLLADYDDPTLMRNLIALTTARDICDTFQSHSIKVELYLNDKYNGVYTLCDQIEVGTSRVGIEEKSSELDTGYLLEMDARASSEGVLNHDYFNLSGKSYTIKSPKTDKSYYSPAQLEYIKQYLTDFEAVIKTPEYENYIDVDSFINYYLVSEIFDSLDIGSIGIYMYKEKGGKLFMGPLWDFDNADCAINTSYKPTPYKIDRMWTFTQNEWAKSLLENEDFVTRFVARWNELYANKIAAIPERISGQKSLLKDSAKRNATKWTKKFHYYDYAASKIKTTLNYDILTNYYLTYMTEHIHYLNTAFNDLM